MKQYIVGNFQVMIQKHKISPNEKIDHKTHVNNFKRVEFLQYLLLDHMELN